MLQQYKNNDICLKDSYNGYVSIRKDYQDT